MAKRALALIAGVVVVIVTLVVLNDPDDGRHRSSASAPRVLESDVKVGAPEDNTVSSGPSKSAVGNARSTSSDTAPMSSVSRWQQAFRASTDHGMFIRDALPAALNGDVEAQYYIFAALRECEPAKRLLADYKELSDITVRPGFTESGRRYLTRLWSLCSGLRTADPFAGVAQTPDPRAPETWLHRAAANEHVLALTVSMFGDVGLSDDRKRAEVIEVARKLDESRDPRAMLYLGAVLSQFGAESSRTGMALMLAACELGASCSEGQADGVIPSCAEVNDPSCIPGGTVADQLARAVGPAEFSRTYAAASELRRQMTAGDSDVLYRAVNSALSAGR